MLDHPFCLIRSGNPLWHTHLKFAEPLARRAAFAQVTLNGRSRPEMDAVAAVGRRGDDARALVVLAPGHVIDALACARDVALDAAIAGAAVVTGVLNAPRRAPLEALSLAPEATPREGSAT